MKEIAKIYGGLVILATLLAALAMILDGAVTAVIGAWHSGIGVEP